MLEYHVLNLGAGVQSTALYLLARYGRLPCDVAIFADTGEEPAVYRHLTWLLSLGKPPIWVRTAGLLGDDLQQGRNSTGQRFASIPAFTAPDHRTRPPGKLRAGRVRRQCTAEYKVDVIERAIRRDLLGLKPRQRIPRDVIVYQYFGITLGESGRAARAKRRFESMTWAKPVYPFLDMGWTRQDCLAWLQNRVPHPVPRSACVFCPFHTNREWAELRRSDPTGWARAVAIDEALRREGNVVNRGLDHKPLSAPHLLAPGLHQLRRPGSRGRGPDDGRRVRRHVRGLIPISPLFQPPAPDAPHLHSHDRTAAPSCPHAGSVRLLTSRLVGSIPLRSLPLSSHTARRLSLRGRKPPAGACKLPRPLSATRKPSAFRLHLRCASVLGRLVADPGKAAWGGLQLESKENAMTHPLDILLCEDLDPYAWDANEVRDLIQTTPLRYDDDGLPVGYEAEQLFGLEAVYAE